MSFVRAKIQGAPYGVTVTDRPEGLSAFLKPDCAAAIWRRQPLPSFQTWIDTLDPELLPRGRVIVPADGVREAVSELCEIAGTPKSQESERLVDDAAALADIFSGLMESPFVRVRLQPVSTNACRKFHVDALTARLVCTYRGPGTQYGVSVDGGDPDQVFTVPTAAPILLRGTVWPETPASGFLHRSPPILGTGVTRLVLVLDPVFNPDDED